MRLDGAQRDEQGLRDLAIHQPIGCRGGHPPLGGCQRVRPRDLALPRTASGDPHLGEDLRPPKGTDPPPGGDPGGGSNACDQARAALAKAKSKLKKLSSHHAAAKKIDKAKKKVKKAKKKVKKDC
jgi:hypothetical protein